MILFIRDLSGIRSILNEIKSNILKSVLLQRQISGQLEEQKILFLRFKESFNKIEKSITENLLHIKEQEIRFETERKAAEPTKWDEIY
jgi:hypothetical protein